MSFSVYLDYNAGSPVRPQVIAAVAEVMAEGGNPSSVHGFGRRARARIENARVLVAEAVGADPRGVIFTSGGTEANAMVLRGSGRKRVLVSAIEHASVLNGADDLSIIPVTSDGVIDLDALDRMLAEEGDALVSVMAANNETGIVQPIDQVIRLSHGRGALVHCDASQGLGRIPLETDADFLTVSAHKVGGSAGVGALILKNSAFPLSALVMGGGQERRLRGGTENISGIVGFGIAAQLASQEVGQFVDLRDGLENQVTACVPGSVVIGKAMPRLPNTVCLGLPGLDTRTQVMALDLDGIMVGAGAACSSGKMGDSLVLKAMGVEPDLARSVVRISFGWASQPDHGQRFLQSWTQLVRRKGLPVIDAAKAA